VLLGYGGTMESDGLLAIADGERLMLEPNVKAALDAAIEGECVARAALNECQQAACTEPCKWCRAGATAAVAAFLAAIPVGLPTNESPSPFRMASSEVRDAWVAQVREAGA